MLKGKHVVLAVTGGIAAYKMATMASLLVKQHADVQVLMTQNATNFINPITFETLTGHKCLVDTFDRNFEFNVEHVSVAKQADIALVAPATANVIGKLANGLADDMLTTTLLACKCKKLVAPAMNTQMYENPIVQDNMKKLEHYGMELIQPVSGHLACGDSGMGKMVEPEVMLQYILRDLALEKDMKGLKVLVTAGPTQEAIDPVRYIANASSGKMGFALAREAARRGASVTLVAGPVSLPTPEGVRRVDVVSAAQMHDAALAAFDGADVAVCAAAVADYTPAEPADHKLKKAREPLDSIRLVRTADVLAELCARKGRRVVVGFAAETDELVPNARAKLRAKGADLIVANDVSRADSTFGSETDAVTLVDASGELELPCLPKDEVARRVMDRVRELALPRDQG